MTAPWAVVPLKSPATAKSRLGGILTPVQRRELYFALARRAIEALSAARGIDRLLVATTSDEAAAFARALGAEVLALQRENGTAAACRDAAQAASLQAPALLMLAGDLPLVSVAAIERLLLAAAPQRGVTVVPDRRGIGTNALLCRPPALLAPCFGRDSFSAHLALARAQHIPLQVHRCGELALDLDVAEDLEFLWSLGGLDLPLRKPLSAA
jgi:2-phospho-L-lactate guanylyltransferase